MMRFAPVVAQTFHTKLNHELNEWNEADAHWDAAAAAFFKFDGSFEREMDKFRRITETWR